MRTDILTAENRIFYYQMIDIGNNFSLLSTRSPLDTIIVTYRDNSVYNDLRIGFAKLYGIPLDSGGLFATDIVYGRGCGFNCREAALCRQGSSIPAIE